MAPGTRGCSARSRSVVAFPIYLTLALAIVAVEHSGRYWAAAGVAGGAVLVFAYTVVRPGRGMWRRAEQWAAGAEQDRTRALEETYAWSRACSRPIIGHQRFMRRGGGSPVSVGLIAGATGPRLARVRRSGEPLSWQAPT